jgi:hypothetical protein
MNRFALVPILLLALAGACTFNTSWLDRQVGADTDPGSFDVLRVEGAPRSVLGATSLRVTGSARDATSATAHLVGILGVNDDADAIARGFTVDWSRIDAATVGVLVDVAPGAGSRAWIDEVHVSLPSQRDLVLRTDDGSIDVSGVSGRVEASASSGSIVVQGAGIVDLTADSGSIVVGAQAGNAHTSSGSIVLDLTGWVSASADSGSIAGRIGGGGDITTSSGSIDVELTQALDRDLVLEAGSGSIELVVPSGASMILDVAADDGSVSIDVGGVRHDGHAFQGAVREGGLTVRARATSGSIVVVERGAS